MFTGIITAVGKAGKSREDAADSSRRFFECPDGWLAGATLGGSVAVNGVCLTAAEFADGGFFADLSAETRRRCAPFLPGDLINLERPLAAGEPLGGHFVAGHVDGVGIIEELRREESGGGMEISVRAPAELMPLIAEKGAVTIDGVSLTVMSVCGEVFSVSIVPHTAQQTNFSAAKTGKRVNLEADLLARHLARLISCGIGGK